MDNPSPPNLKMSRNEALALLFCLLLGFGLRFHAFDQKSLWMDEVYTYEDSRDGLRAQLKFYHEDPTYLHPPLFYILTHQFYPLHKPERDLRIIPLIFGTLSIPMLYLLARSFSILIALPCTLSLTFMTYHISVSQDGRVYSLLMFLAMASIFLFIKYLKTLNRVYLVFTALIFAVLFFSSYSSIPFIIFSQILWFYRPSQDHKKPPLSSFFILSGLTLLLILPWILFVAFNYKGALLMDPSHTENPGSFLSILYGVMNDWVPYPPLLITSAFVLILSPFISKNKRNVLVFLTVFFLPIVGLYLFCKLLNVTHFVTSRYLITFLPLFFICLYSSLFEIETKFHKLKRWMRLTVLLVILLIASNMVILPLYYRSEKQDLRRLVAYLKEHLQEGDRIFVHTTGYMPGILHYFGADPQGRHHVIHPAKDKEGRDVYLIAFTYNNKAFTLWSSRACCSQYVADGNRLWMVVVKWGAQRIQKESPAVLKGYFDGSFLNFNRFPVDASMYLFLWDPKSPDEKGIDLPID